MAVAIKLGLMQSNVQATSSAGNVTGANTQIHKGI